MQNINLPETGFVKLQTILQFIPVSQTTWRQGVKDGIFPEPVRVGGKVTLWRVEDIKKLIKGYSSKISDNNNKNIEA
jgi:predicted DNA-binding transcriptional regulator AlpA